MDVQQNAVGNWTVARTPQGECYIPVRELAAGAKYDRPRDIRRPISSLASVRGKPIVPAGLTVLDAYIALEDALHIAYRCPSEKLAPDLIAAFDLQHVPVQVRAKKPTKVQAKKPVTTRAKKTTTEDLIVSIMNGIQGMLNAHAQLISSIEDRLAERIVAAIRESYVRPARTQGFLDPMPAASEMTEHSLADDVRLADPAPPRFRPRVSAKKGNKGPLGD